MSRPMVKREAKAIAEIYSFAVIIVAKLRHYKQPHDASRRLRVEMSKSIVDIPAS